MFSSVFSVSLWQIRSLPPQLPVRPDRKQSPLRQLLAERRLIQRKVHAVHLLIASPEFARVFF